MFYVYVHVCVCMHVCLHTCMHLRVCVCVCVCVYIIYHVVCVYMCVHACVLACIHVCVCVCVTVVYYCCVSLLSGPHLRQMSDTIYISCTAMMLSKFLCFQFTGCSLWRAEAGQYYEILR